MSLSTQGTVKREVDATQEKLVVRQRQIAGRPGEAGFDNLVTPFRPHDVYVSCFFVFVFTR